MAPIAVQSAVAYGVSPLPMLFAVTFGASLLLHVALLHAA